MNRIIIPSIHEIEAIRQFKLANRNTGPSVIAPRSGALLGYTDVSLPRYIPESTNMLVVSRYIHNGD